MTNERDYVKEFGQRMEGLEGVLQTSAGLNPDPQKAGNQIGIMRTKGKHNAYNYINKRRDEQGENPLPINSSADVLNDQLSAYVTADNEAAQVYFGSNWKNMVGSLKESDLEKLALTLPDVKPEDGNEKLKKLIAKKNESRYFAESFRNYETMDDSTKERYHNNLAAKLTEKEMKKYKDKGYSDGALSLIYYAMMAVNRSTMSSERVKNEGEQIIEDVNKEFKAEVKNYGSLKNYVMTSVENVVKKNPELAMNLVYRAIKKDE
ncbi:MAG: hypothetical protein WCK90_05425 [archaeon]